MNMYETDLRPKQSSLVQLIVKSINITSLANAIITIMCIISSPETHIMSNLHFNGLNAVSRNQIVNFNFGHGQANTN